MKISLDWLNQYLDRPAAEHEVEPALTAVGFPVESREHTAGADGRPDVVFDVEVTSNRSDCLSHVGVARELAAATGRALREPTAELPPAADRVASLTRVDNHEPTLCPVYTARVIRGVRIGPSPAWLAQRLERVGLRPVNNVVDVTNFVLHELGQPLHAFDLAALHERRIVVRRARTREPFVAIDGSKHELDDQMLVIADADRVTAVAGVMGGLETEVSDATADVLLESAAFDPVSVRRTSRLLKLMSDSSYRFERGVDPRGVERASRRAAALIVEVAGGELAEGVIRVGEAEPEPTEVTMRCDRCRSLLGEPLEDARQAELLERLGLSPRQRDGRIACRVPTHRRDLKREVDLIEEVARLHGLENVPVRPRIELDVRPKQPELTARQLVARVLVAHGFHEAMTPSFLAERHGRPFLANGDEAVLLADERRKAEPMLRPSLLPSLLLCRKSNQDAGNADVRLFETASTWSFRDGRVMERQRLTLLTDASGDGGAAVRALRGTLAELVQHLGGDGALARLTVEPADAPTLATAGTVKLGDEALGVIGVLDAATRDLFDLKVATAALEVDLPPLLSLYPPRRQVSELPRFPAIERDLSILVDESVRWAEVERLVRGTEPAMLERLSFLDVYRGKPIPKGRKSVSLRMHFRDPHGTLRHEQVDPQVRAVVESLQKQLNAELRA